MTSSPSAIGEEIKQSEQLILQCKEDLKKSRVIRRHRQEYDAMAKVCMSHDALLNVT